MPRTRFVNMYGPTETTVNASSCTVSHEQNIPSIGQPIRNSRIYILDEHQQLVPQGVIGELYLAGDNVARGYLNQPELTAKSFFNDPFMAQGQRMYKSGDLGRWLSNGKLEYIGRNDFQVKLRGYRIELGEIEANLNRCVGIRESVVVARDDQAGNKQLVAYLILEKDFKLEPLEIRHQLTLTLADYMLPSAYVALSAFPLTPNNKLDRKALLMPDYFAVASEHYEEPIGEIEKTLSSIWQSLLGVPRIGRHDNFFELGGHSLNAIQLLSRMEKADLKVSLAHLFANPTLSKLALFIANAQDGFFEASIQDAVPLKTEGKQLPLFLLHEPSGDPLIYSQLVSLLTLDRPIYVLQAIGIHTIEGRPNSLVELAAYHIEAICRVQPKGPYHLGGWSLGGVLAYEIAYQLYTCGEKIAFIGMIDSYNPAMLTEVLKRENEAIYRDEMVINFISAHISRVENAGIALNQFDKLTKPLDLMQVYTLCLHNHWLPTDVTYEALIERLDTAMYLRRLASIYQPTSSALAVHIYLADEGDDPWHGWENIVNRNSVLHPIGGTHNSIMQRPFLQQLANKMMKSIAGDQVCNSLVTIQRGACNAPNLFCIPGAGALAFSYLDLAQQLPKDLSVYALQARGLSDPHDKPYLTIEETARDYIDAMKQIQPKGPYNLVGHSFGGWIAFEMALQLQKQKEFVDNLILLDSRPFYLRDEEREIYHEFDSMMKLIEIYNQMLKSPITISNEVLSLRTTKQQLAYLFEELIQAGIYTRNTSVSILEGVFQLMHSSLNTFYMPQSTYQGHVLSINAAGTSSVIKEKREIALKHYAANATSRVSSGNHMSMLAMPNSKTLAEVINHYSQLYKFDIQPIEPKS